jgi:anaerobic magnesium-protoporphyrin IX monomethyl ester cyclase
MNVLLINPPAENELPSEVPRNLFSERGLNPPLGLLYLASSLRAAGHAVRVHDAPAEGGGYAGVSEAVRGAGPGLVAISAMSFTLLDALFAAKAAKEAQPDAKVVLGGPHPSVYPRETVALPNVDYAVAGEGERTLVALAGALEGGGFEGVPGLAFRRGGIAVSNGMSPPIDDLDSLPFPARRLTHYWKYSSLLARRSPATTMFTSRGCPHRCVFCDRPQMGKRFRARSARNVAEEMQECEGMGIREILVYDDTFTLDRKRVLDICSEIRGRGLDVGWDVRARVDTVDAELLSAMRSAGCERIHFGVESGNEAVLSNLCKGITLPQAREAFRLAKAAGIGTLAYFMIGSPGETARTVEDTIRFAMELDPDYAHFTLTTPFPGTDLYREGLESGLLKNDAWLSFARDPGAGFVPPLWEEGLKRDELKSLLSSAYKRFYLRPGYAARELSRVRSGGELLRKAKAGLKVLGL